MDLGILREKRRKEGISLEDLGSYLEVSRELLGKFERGVVSPRLDKLQEWCDRLGFEVRIVSKEEETIK